MPYEEHTSLSRLARKRYQYFTPFMVLGAISGVILLGLLFDGVLTGSDPFNFGEVLVLFACGVAVVVVAIDILFMKFLQWGYVWLVEIVLWLLLFYLIQ